MIEVVQAFHRTPITCVDSDDAAALDCRIDAAERAFAERDAWLKPYQRIEIRRRLTPEVHHAITCHYGQMAELDAHDFLLRFTAPHRVGPGSGLIFSL